jgi:hypothetical protein
MAILMPIKVELFDNLDAVAADAGEALSRAGQSLPFDRLDWYRLIARHTPPEGKLLIARAREGADAAWLFLSVNGRAGAALTNWYSFRHGVIGSGRPDLVRAIAAKLRGRLATLSVGPLDKTEELTTALRHAGWFVRQEEMTGSWQADTAGLSFANYWAARPGQLRSTFKRKSKASRIQTEIHLCFNPEAWDAYLSVYERSWKGTEGAPEMLRELAETEAAASTLRLGIARKDGVPVAAQLWLVENGTAWIHKLAYDEAYKTLSPGTILSEAMFRHAIDVDRVERIDFGTGDDPYKRDWMDRRVPLWRLTAFNPRSPSGLTAAGRAAASALVRRLRSR